MNAQNALQDKDLGDRRVQAYCIFFGYAALLLVIAFAAREFFVVLSLSTMLVVTVISIYILGVLTRLERKEFTRALLGALCAWATTIAAVTVMFWASPWGGNVSGFRLSLLFGVSAIWAILAFGLLWQYNKLYPPAAPRDLAQFALKATAIVGSVGYIILSILWVFVDSPVVTYSKWPILVGFGLAAVLSLYKGPMVERWRKWLFITWGTVFAWGVLMGLWALAQVFSQELWILSIITVCTAMGMMVAAFKGPWERDRTTE